MFDLLRTLLQRDSNESLIKQAHDHLQGMLREAEQLMRQIHPVLMRFDALVDLQEAASEADRRSDEHDRAMRRALLGHLSMSRTAIEQSLGLFSVGSRAERVVDLAREVVEISSWVRNPLPQVYMAQLTAAYAELIGFLSETQVCLAVSDSYRTLALLDKQEEFRQRISELIVGRILEDAALTARQSVILYRSFHIATRMAAQLSNIAAIVVLPLEHIDFVSADAVAQARNMLHRRSSVVDLAGEESHEKTGN